IPISESAQDHQRSNAYSYARTGAAHVLEEQNLTGHLLVAEIRRLLENQDKLQNMRESALEFARPDAAQKIAREIINLALEHTQ
ncbi:MAG: glycosyltransferase, partial [Patescibacteria group bacterium]